MKLGLICILVLWTMSCKMKTNSCLEDYAIFDESIKNPMLSITEKNSSGTCIYSVIGFFCFEGQELNRIGTMSINSERFYLRFTDPLTSEFLIFNLNSEVGDEYQSKIEFLSSNFPIKATDLKVKLENKVMWKMKPVYIFRIYNSICYEGEMFDQVFLVMKQKGIIGSYISKIHGTDCKEDEFFCCVGGNILEDVINYSNKSLGKLL